MPNEFSQALPIADEGSGSPEIIYLAVGHALTTWEGTEQAFAHLFARFIRPLRGSFVARRAFGAVQSSSGRSSLIDEAAEVFFRDFPSNDMQLRFRTVMKTYKDATAKRNQIAHGIIMPSGPSLQKGHYLAASMYTSKRRIDLSSPYYYTGENIDHFRVLFGTMGYQTHNFVQAIDEHFRTSPASSRERY
ncbi:hypothetical protein [Lichenihabitans psoromatis]|uniref:hypothetical protein n=1 Tax=Lichenihabitans psoromatis TaxID=2528642 RepID=UPI001038504F|nr:hypothetical protein [Lichenihabitans psoromatis]